VRSALRIVRAMKTCRRPGETAERVALRKRARRRLRRPADANAIVRPAPVRDNRRDSDVAIAIVRRAAAGDSKQSSRSLLRAVAREMKPSAAASGRQFEIFSLTTLIQGVGEGDYARRWWLARRGRLVHRQLLVECLTFK